MKKPRKPTPQKKVEQATPEQTAAQLQLLLKKFDLRVEPLSDLNRHLKKSDLICWQGSAINLPTTGLPDL